MIHVTTMAVGGALLALLCLPTSAASQDADWTTASQRLAIDREITVVLPDGSMYKGVLTAVDRSGVAVSLDAGTVRYDVFQISELRRRGDRVWNGALTGAAVGAGYMLSAGSRCMGEACRYTGAFTAVGAVAGFGVGLVVDALRVGTTTVYRARGPGQIALVPVVGRHVYGVMGRVTFGR